MNAVETQGLRCAVHEDRAAIERCESCGRPVCLDCAVPYRGAVRCERCVAREFGTPEPTPARRRSAPPELVAAVALSVAVLASTLPWHRSGTLTSALSAWRPSLDPWASGAVGAALVSFLLAGLALLRPRGRSGAMTASWGALAGLSAVCTGVAVLRAPGFFSLTPWPYVFAIGAVGAVAVAVVRLRRGRERA